MIAAVQIAVALKRELQPAGLGVDAHPGGLADPVGQRGVEHHLHLEQRVGRAARPGAARGWVQTYIPYIRGAGVEPSSRSLPRGAEHHSVLDSFEGVAANQSTIASQLGAITGQVADAKHDAGYAATAARLRVAASVFGT